MCHVNLECLISRAIHLRDGQLLELLIVLIHARIQSCKIRISSSESGFQINKRIFCLYHPRFCGQISPLGFLVVNIKYEGGKGNECT